MSARRNVFKPKQENITPDTLNSKVDPNIQIKPNAKFFPCQQPRIRDAYRISANTIPAIFESLRHLSLIDTALHARRGTHARNLTSAPSNDCNTERNNKSAPQLTVPEPYLNHTGYSLVFVSLTKETEPRN
ncbi:BHH_G0046380.mRNA.1.CDS.1 [Saccharomyces cerevisiae]|nr:BHH_G0046380.mRNA.1.CDS.1 [Saccharomyces cerevisiae]CAI7313416.1 BHH_G0046380.mRNA.1.CDS.1 [Saccharomyces cerevisiae]